MKNHPSMSGIIVVLVIGAYALTAHAATMNITAKFAPDIHNPKINEFTNTTPISGYCAKWPKYCKNNVLSIATSLTTKQQYRMKARDSDRNSAFFGFPSNYRNVEVVDRVTGARSTLKFRIAGFSARNWNAGNSNWITKDDRNATWGYYPPAPCLSGGPAVGGNWIQFAWAIKEKKDVRCVMYSKVDRNANITFDQISYAYELITPNPLEMGSGVYTGSIQLGVGPTKDIDFGDNFIANDDVLDVNFTLTVNHELKVTPALGAKDVTLYPCYYGSTCSKESAKKNWERWMVTNIPPQRMSGLSRFNISSSGSFTVYMMCGGGSMQSSDSCPMISNKSNTIVPIKALLTLPDNITDQTGKGVVDKPLYTGKDISRNKFITSSFGIDQPGQVDFVIDKKYIGDMLKSRPDSWSGSVTLMFDPNIY